MHTLARLCLTEGSNLCHFRATSLLATSDRQGSKGPLLRRPLLASCSFRAWSGRSAEAARGDGSVALGIGRSVSLPFLFFPLAPEARRTAVALSLSQDSLSQQQVGTRGRTSLAKAYLLDD